MEHHLLSPARLADAIRREWRLRHLSNPNYGFVFEPAPANEWVSLACATTGFDVQHDQILSLCAVRIAGKRIVSSERFEVLLQASKPVPTAALREHRLREADLAQGLSMGTALAQLLHFVGSRPLVGYYLDFDMRMLEPSVKALLGIALPHETIEVSRLYYDWKFKQLTPYQQQQGEVQIDLRYASILENLDLPKRDLPDTLDKAVMTALMFIKLQALTSH